MLEIDGLRKRYGDKTALDGVGFTVRPGEMFGFVGANGAGKTTTMRIVMGVLGADSGEVRLDGRPLGYDDRRAFGYMPEERGLYQKMKVAEQIEYFGRLHGLAPAAARTATDALLERLGLVERRDDAVEALSLGNQQRVQLAVALVHEPTVLILDEPFSGLDPLAVDALAEVLKDRAAEGVPVIFSSHQLDLVERLCDSVGIISAGRMVAYGPVAELREREGRGVLRVVVRDAAPGWADGLPGRIAREGDRDVLLCEEGDDQAVLRTAMGAGTVEHFGRRQPTLTEIFREAVA
ncbi:ATP-binding cassette domain-containing protein [Microbispora triticiradicis]|uniref:ATP-binding cassette domain-containing protein n=3 Tax=Microbispora TaxID=2005 RepID=A0ABY3LNP7_9ACTN|nr:MULTISPECIES: ATP-binding cassette domain-containing protein [Microbispora]RGA01565.1 ATP-binding cassette domain-containing protein [Microbispora triticiradicis]TLP58812.1 ATP-binding cassette domain-containing protein [Microbispora fusca]TYB45089.1 ATP-binding cassette domain-containing protein [Microbispora tritici]GLW21520.1 ABC transporter ATP-binding protein [Microbispora amethystogenes]